MTVGMTAVAVSMAWQIKIVDVIELQIENQELNQKKT